MNEEQDKMMYTQGNNHLANYSLPDENSVMRTQNPLLGTASRTVVKPGFNRGDRDFYRPEEALPTKHEDIIIACQAVYKKVGLVRNIIDLMTDFASDGLELQHPVKKNQRFFRKWAEKVKLADRAHDFMKLLMRDGNVIVRRKNAIISVPVYTDMSKAGTFDYPLLPVDETLPKETPIKIKREEKSTKREIPWSYTFLSPTLVQKIGGCVGKFTGDTQIAFKIPPALKSSILNPKTEAERSIVKKLPKELVEAIKKDRHSLVALDPDKIYIDYYKKDDWEDWGTPFLYGVLEDIFFKEKMRLADISALDGVINTVRVWKLGRSDKDILPTRTAVSKLLDLLSNSTGGGILDIVWDDMIDFKVEYPPTDKILGPEKYVSVDADIVRGLGIPSVLIGGADDSKRNSGSTFVQLKTLVERLEYIRNKCMEWINNELRMVADAVGIKELPRVSFGIMSLRDEAAEKALLVQLLDRNVISVETVQKAFGHDFVMELSHMRDEEAVRKAEAPIMEKAGPFYRPPSQIEMLDALNDDPAKEGTPPTKKKGGDNLKGDQPRTQERKGPGRPINTIDTKPRDERTPRILAVYKAIAEKLLGELDNILDPIFLEKNNIKNMRSLTNVNKNELNTAKMAIMACLSKDDVVTVDTINNNEMSVAKINDFCQDFARLLEDHLLVTKREPTYKEKRSLMCSAWALMQKGE